ncbi:glycosyltransferase family 2 protein [Amycolatopsis saalfeldensis]|uniref:Glucosyl-3-phosphoglycerate synthase n=1 Tax=Amycolatopsis saalfeldensis TaxID=394193 RepID=A0A1H8YCN2_9PSEU|nr:glycosyltransferase family 2 protein [Amycolatopsis saalfeldensis]SEP49753.1 Glycosyl transferase family 2 [Amycolatopsis saalfeldensis]
MVLDKPRRRTVAAEGLKTLSVVIPAYNEEGTIAQAVQAAEQGLAGLEVDGEVLVSASGCTDGTAEVARAAGAAVVVAERGKGAAIRQGVDAAKGDVVCLMDADLEYYGEVPLVELLAGPIFQGIADATIANLYWRPIYPDHWLNGFFAPLAGLLFPEMLPKVGSTPWSGQRAAVRGLWPEALPGGFTSDLAITLHWNDHAELLRPVLTDDWFNPVRPKPEILGQDFALLMDHAVKHGRIQADLAERVGAWFRGVAELIGDYDESHPDPMGYQRKLFEQSHRELQRKITTPE